MYFGNGILLRKNATVRLKAVFFFFFFFFLITVHSGQFVWDLQEKVVTFNNHRSF